MKHLTNSDIERYNRNGMGVFKRICVGLHLEECKECSKLLDNLKEDDKLQRDLREAMQRQADEEITESDKTYAFLKNKLG